LLDAIFDHPFDSAGDHKMTNVDGIKKEIQEASSEGVLSSSSSLPVPATTDEQRTWAALFSRPSEDLLFLLTHSHTTEATGIITLGSTSRGHETRSLGSTSNSLQDALSAIERKAVCASAEGGIEDSVEKSVRKSCLQVYFCASRLATNMHSSNASSHVGSSHGKDSTAAVVWLIHIMNFGGKVCSFLCLVKRPSYCRRMYLVQL
jgi:hypothetical protein